MTSSLSFDQVSAWVATGSQTKPDQAIHLLRCVARLWRSWERQKVYVSIYPHVSHVCFAVLFCVPNSLVIYVRRGVHLFDVLTRSDIERRFTYDSLV
ncbi:Protein of unknown function [Pyronema omphalodes CBS 100304]|uniref:Uncharacterized protein n=1 Tax=Pyronema omphalodes (strain CBS 100304) TaxID=1076935 RepID=U4LVV0_PYROM|nr:Protein of unknown function [Pyronema omphalodes CBS 100304]